MSPEVKADILLVDDNKHQLFIAKEFLNYENSNFHIRTATSAQDALRKLEEEHFDVIISDYQMPSMDGLELLEALRSTGNDIPFIIFTGRGREEVAMQALNLGADYYLMKGPESRSTFGELAHILTRVIEHRHTEIALKKSNERFRVTFENAAIGIGIIDLNGKVMSANPALQAFLGYDEEELGQMTLPELIHPDDVQREMDLFQKLIEGKRDSYHIEERVIRSDGQVKWGCISASLVRDEYGQPQFAIGMIEDINARKQAEQALQESEERFRFLSEASFEGVFIHDQGVILDANQTYAQKLGFEVSEVIGKNGLEHAVPESRPAILKHIMSGSEKPFEVMALRKDGSTFPVEVLGKNIEYNGRTARVTATRDLTERRLIERTLQESEERCQQTFRAIPAPAYLYRKLPDGRIILVDVNKATLEISQGQAAFCVNHELEDMILADNFSPMLQRAGIDLWEVAVNVRGVFQNGEPLRVEKEFRLQSGEHKFFLLDYVQTSPDSVLLISTDVTERQKRVEELSEFVDAMVHDLQTPLLSIDGYADLLQNDYDEKSAKAIGRVVQRIQHLLGRFKVLAEAGELPTVLGNI
ncbi:MAG: PAS domain S-box protein [Candidatus Hodarchaeales archaeon]|jgi:PAS domain S-box-containing protein